MNPLPRAIWIDRFVMRAGELVPGSSPQQIQQHVEGVYEYAGDMSPEEAAEIFALELPPDDDGAPGN